MGFGIAYFDCCNKLDSEMNGDRREDNTMTHNKPCEKGNKQFTKEHFENIMDKYNLKRYISSKTLHAPRDKKILKKWMKDNKVYNAEDNINNRLVLWDKFWDSIDFVSLRDVNAKDKVLLKRHLNVIDKLMYGN